ncbi:MULTISPECIES: hypothetical protein [Gulbenkiania]|uniref:Roadblock/LC7 domain n=1 Tax=Gulbenkiania indica TaxID=375574 RepID=A0A0K6GXT2_9NEIS|nr:MULTISPECIES: hypothetical protein [Gulbenkiania]CUA83385.1 hypothetical protein Ga0061063_1717 [Gulbenkiania indica]
MSQTLRLHADLYAEATPAGTYYAVSGPQTGADRTLLLHILQQGPILPLNEERLLAWSGLDSIEEALSVLYRLQRLDFVLGRREGRPVPAGNLESRLPELLAALSSEGRALLADDNGLYYATSGFMHETAEEIAALAGDTMAMSRRHARLLNNHLGLQTAAWALTDPAGQAELGFYPLYIGRQAFVLVIGGLPKLQGQAFVDMVEALCRRYA